MSTSRAARTLPPLAAAAAFTGIAAISLQRRALNYGSETDFLGAFVPEARRFLAGQPMLVDYHPPAYPIVLAAVQTLVGDWLRSGLLLSLASAFVAAWCSWVFFRGRYGTAAAIGAVAGMLLSGPFLSYSVQASGDMFFLALVMATLLALWKAETTTRGWLAAGALLGLTILSRTNGVALVVLLMATLRTRDARRALLLALLGLALPIGAWLAYSQATGAPFLPRYTHHNLALTYLAEGDRVSGDALQAASRGVDSAWDVLARNPSRVARIYASDLVLNLQNAFSGELLAFPLSHVALGGLVLLLWVHLGRYDAVLPAALLTMFLLLNFKAWEARYHLYLVPFLGAGLALAVVRLHALAAAAGRQRFAAVAAVVVAVLAGFEVARGIRREWSDLSHDAAEAATVLDGYGVPPTAVVVARKPHVCFYSRVECEGFPDVSGVEGLRESLVEVAARVAPPAPLFVYYGWVERETRPGLDQLLRPVPEPPWLRRIGTGRNKQRKWVLFEVVRGELGPVGPAGNGASDAS